MPSNTASGLWAFISPAGLAYIGSSGHLTRQRQRLVDALANKTFDEALQWHYDAAPAGWRFVVIQRESGSTKLGFWLAAWRYYSLYPQLLNKLDSPALETTHPGYSLIQPSRDQIAALDHRLLTESRRPVGSKAPGSRQAKPVRATNKDTGEVRCFRSAGDAALILCGRRTGASNISQALQGRLAHAYGYRWTPETDANAKFEWAASDEDSIKPQAHKPAGLAVSGPAANLRMPGPDVTHLARVAAIFRLNPDRLGQMPETLKEISRLQQENEDLQVANRRLEEELAQYKEEA